MAVVFIGFLVIGFALPVLPLHVHQTLGFGTFVVGLVTGSQFAAAVFSRVWAGHYSDSRGAKRAVMIGLMAATASGALYLLSLAFASPLTAVTILLLGRALLGGAESFIITGAVSWGLVLVHPEYAGRVIAWVGTAMFAALALGAPIGTTFYETGGFTAITMATILLPLATLPIVLALKPVQHRADRHESLLSVISSVWVPGIGAALSSIGFGAILAFGSLLFAQRGWRPIWLPFSAYAAALIAARILFGHLPDKFGGAKVALISVLIEAAGLVLLWLAQGPIAAAVGAALTGVGYALVYPGLGLEAVRRAPPQSRGLVMGLYTVCLDMALGFGSPLLGLVASLAGLASVFLVSTLIVLCTAFFAVPLLRSPLIP